MAASTLTLVIPAYNEAENLPRVLPGILSICQERGWQLVVVNDGSQDNTREVLKTFADCSCLTVVHHKLNRGYGAALKTGLAQAQTEYVVTMDADGQHCIEDVEAMLQTAVVQDADMVVGRRQYLGKVNWYRELGKRLIRIVTNLLLPIHVHDLNSGFKLYRTELVQGFMYSVPDSMSFSDIITLVFISEGCLVVETPVNIRPRTGGKSTITTRTAFETLFEILNIVLYFNPMKVFLPVSMFFLLFGVLWGLPILIRGRGVSVGSMLLIVIGVILLFLGLIAEQLSSLRKDIIRLRMDKK
jgi:glycosyltransferase involved in cell wall biosynthesis